MASFGDRELAILILGKGGALIIDGKVVIIKAGPFPDPWKELSQEIDQLARVLVHVSKLPEGNIRTTLFKHINNVINEKIESEGMK